jgi:hypothetical protein
MTALFQFRWMQDLVPGFPEDSSGRVCNLSHIGRLSPCRVSYHMTNSTSCSVCKQIATKNPAPFALSSRSGRSPTTRGPSAKSNPIVKEKFREAGLYPLISGRNGPL